MKTFLITGLPWLLCAILLGAVWFLWTRQQTVRSELGRVQEDYSELKQSTEQQEKRAVQLQEAELERLRKDNRELYTLRNEVTQLRQDKQQLNQETQAAQALRAQVQELQTIQAENRQLRAQARQFEVARTTAQSNACINNLRQIDGATQQWALENRKSPNSLVQAEDIAPYLRGNPLPVCPAGGTYTLYPVGIHPVCSIPGHALPAIPE